MEINVAMLHGAAASGYPLSDRAPDNPLNSCCLLCIGESSEVASAVGADSDYALGIPQTT